MIDDCESEIGKAPLVLDACCGSRMFWFNRRDPRALFVDKRREACIADTREGRREIVVDPDVLADFKALPFGDGAFNLVVFDPPHTFSGPNGWMSKNEHRVPVSTILALTPVKPLFGNRCGKQNKSHWIVFIK